MSLAHDGHEVVARRRGGSSPWGRTTGERPARNSGDAGRSYTAAVPEPASRSLEWRERWFGSERRQRVRTGARRHWVFLAVLGVGFALRVVTQIAYRPALLYIDSYRYLGNLHDLDPAQNSQPIGYIALLLRPVLSVGNLAVVAGVQHIIGLGMGVAIYALLVRLGVRRWVAVLAAVPVLLDAYQLQIEQNIMSETLFEALILAAVVLLLWTRPPPIAALAIGGALFGLAATVRVRRRRSSSFRPSCSRSSPARAGGSGSSAPRRSGWPSCSSSRRTAATPGSRRETSG